MTYVARLAVDNKDLSLRPGMTASATIRATERNQVLLVPNAALRFTPVDSSASTPAAKPSGSGGLVGQMMPRPMRQRSGGARPGGESATPGQLRSLWVLRQEPGQKEGEGQPEMVRVKTGLSDGRTTEIEVRGDALKEGDLLITDQRSAAGAGA